MEKCLIHDKAQHNKKIAKLLKRILELYILRLFVSFLSFSKFFLLQVKRSVMISNKNCTNELFHELSNDLQRSENLGKSQNCTEL